MDSLLRQMPARNCAPPQIRRGLRQNPSKHVKNFCVCSQSVNLRNRRNPAFGVGVETSAMNEELSFLREAAMQLRELARIAPDIAPQLDRLADEIEAAADEFAERRSGKLA